MSATYEPETTRQVLATITDLARQLADRSDALLAEFFSDARGVMDDLRDLRTEIEMVEGVLAS